MTKLRPSAASKRGGRGKIVELAGVSWNGAPVALLQLRRRSGAKLPAWEISSANPVAREMFNLPEADVTGSAIETVLPTALTTALVKFGSKSQASEGRFCLDPEVGPLGRGLQVTADVDGTVMTVAALDITDLLVEKAALEEKYIDLQLSNETLEEQAADLAVLAEEIEVARQTLGAEVERRSALEAELRYLALYDEMTGIANRRSFLTDAHQIIADAPPDQDLALFQFDIDHFKLVNDTFGHAVGDHVIRAVAERVSQGLADVPDALFGRVGGEEFAVLLKSYNLAEAMEIAERLRLAVSSLPVAVEGITVCTSISIGVTVRRQEDEKLDSLMARADLALYAAKRSGRDRVKSDRDAALTDMRSPPTHVR